jgi:hypothetical protein
LLLVLLRVVLLRQVRAAFGRVLHCAVIMTKVLLVVPIPVMALRLLLRFQLARTKMLRGSRGHGRSYPY